MSKLTAGKPANGRIRWLSSTFCGRLHIKIKRYTRVVNIQAAILGDMWPFTKTPKSRQYIRKHETSGREWAARKLLETYLPHDKVVYNVRPEWIVNPETNNALELDIFFPDLKIAFEVQGEQHNHFTPGLQSSRDEFTRQVGKDGIKVRACAEAGVTLYTLTATQLTQPLFEPFITRLLFQLGRGGSMSRITPPTGLYRFVDKLASKRVVAAPKTRSRYTPARRT